MLGVRSSQYLALHPQAMLSSTHTDGTDRGTSILLKTATLSTTLKGFSTSSTKEGTWAYDVPSPPSSESITSGSSLDDSADASATHALRKPSTSVPTTTSSWYLIPNVNTTSAPKTPPGLTLSVRRISPRAAKARLMWLRANGRVPPDFSACRPSSTPPPPPPLPWPYIAASDADYCPSFVEFPAAHQTNMETIEDWVAVMIPGIAASHAITIRTVNPTSFPAFAFASGANVAKTGPTRLNTGKCKKLALRLVNSETYWSSQTLNDLAWAFIKHATDTQHARPFAAALFAKTVRDQLAETAGQWVARDFVGRLENNAMTRFASQWYSGNRYSIMRTISARGEVHGLETYRKGAHISTLIGLLFNYGFLKAECVVACLQVLMAEMTHVEHLLAVERIVRHCGRDVWRARASRTRFHLDNIVGARLKGAHGAVDFVKLLRGRVEELALKAGTWQGCSMFRGSRWTRQALYEVFHLTPGWASQNIAEHVGIWFAKQFMEVDAMTLAYARADYRKKKAARTPLGVTRGSRPDIDCKSWPCSPETAQATMVKAGWIPAVVEVPTGGGSLPCTPTPARIVPPKSGSIFPSPTGKSAVGEMKKHSAPQHAARYIK
ncbi:hypothetical protein PUNSTDRAFT_41968 [Punctularia strigosozonata HHB-11173 SS5]|uniref:uncharacterized protein n=1 Tax=Punctularia strigosozonata (strain HHB-11173) TaxID=741275 RepID=UPI0004416ED8|nr:uncharacterized protein PUNSTDRAFT_41968 [Punctularia strigosozonata HHB-11173 SS5]EIN12305.1 hypothetical protein PUNSTDRAFT_41968 [Punctularia strigosozonata HHB-11173 SS5]